MWYWEPAEDETENILDRRTTDANLFSLFVCRWLVEHFVCVSLVLLKKIPFLIFLWGKKEEEDITKQRERERERETR